MSSAGQPGDRPVVVVTGGGGGIGAAVAEELGRRGQFVVTLDPLVSTDGAEQLPAPRETTADRIIARGGAARASTASVTDGAAVRDLLVGLVDELGRLDAVVNVAGISRPTSFATGAEQDWSDVLGVHLDGYLNVLGAALPIMAASGSGRIVGVTSGSGWRPADTGAYGCAKRSVAALTWQLGDVAPPGVVVNAMSPIAATRMVTEALERAQRARGAGTGPAASGGLSLGSMPTPDDIGPLGAHLAGAGFSWCTGQVIFAGGSEVAVVDRPRLLEVIRSEHTASLAHALETVIGGAWSRAEASQSTSGGSNPRFGAAFDEAAAAPVASSTVRRCAIVADDPRRVAGIVEALDARGVACIAVPAPRSVVGFELAGDVLSSAVERLGPLDAVVVAMTGAHAGSDSEPPWARVLAEHAGIVERVHTDAAWARAVADHSARADRPLRLVTLTDAATSGGWSRGQSSAQLARAAQGATDGRVAAFAISVESRAADGGREVGELTAHLLASPEAVALSGAELVIGTGWFGLRSHPRPGGSIAYGGPALPAWFDDTLREVVTGRRSLVREELGR